MKLCSILVCFLSKCLRKKRQIWASEDSEQHFVGSQVVTHDLGWWFRYLSRFQSCEVKCVQLGCFHTGRPLCTQLLSGQGRPPSTILGVRKPEALGYPVVKAASFCIRSFWHNTRVWQTDGQRDGYAAHSIAKLALPCAVIKIVNKSSRVNFNRNKNNTLTKFRAISLQISLRLFGNFREFSGNFRKY